MTTAFLSAMLRISVSLLDIINAVLLQEDAAKGNKRKRNRRRKRKLEDAEELDAISLRVMSKYYYVFFIFPSVIFLLLICMLVSLLRIEWKVWRKKYLAIQKAAMSEIKKSLVLITNEMKKSQHDDSKRYDGKDGAAAEQPKKIEVIKFVPDVILRVTLKKPVDDLKAFKVSILF